MRLRLLCDETRCRNGADYAVARYLKLQAGEPLPRRVVLLRTCLRHRDRLRVVMVDAQIRFQNRPHIPDYLRADCIDYDEYVYERVGDGGGRS